MSSPSSSGQQRRTGTDTSVARVAVENHPLAAGAMTDPSQLPPPQQGLSPPPVHNNHELSTASRPSGGESTTNAPPKTLDALADEFLSSKQPPSVSLKPNPLPRGQVGILRLRTLVERRAWGDVLKLAISLLHDDDSSRGSPQKKSSPKNKDYSRVYQSLLFARGESADENLQDTPLETKLETVEIMVLRCNALLKLRRYTDLSKEIEQWKFLKQNDVKAPIMEWLPWGIRESPQCPSGVLHLILFSIGVVFFDIFGSKLEHHGFNLLTSVFVVCVVFFQLR